MPDTLKARALHSSDAFLWHAEEVEEALACKAALDQAPLGSKNFIVFDSLAGDDDDDEDGGKTKKKKARSKGTDADADASKSKKRKS